jgi:crossover junction endodeoxyribonuclease RuvC
VASSLVSERPPWPVVLGIDPGTRVLGFGALVDAPDGPRLLACGVLRATASADVPRRLAELAGDLERLLGELRPGMVVVESAFSARNVQSALRIGEARGMVLATAARAGHPVSEMAPAAAKKAVLGHGAASKRQVAAMVAALLGTPRLDVPSDATDALALALAHLHRSAVVGRLARQRP